MMRCSRVWLSNASALLATFGPFDIVQSAAHSGVVEVQMNSRNNKLNLLDDSFVRNLPLAMAFLNEDLNSTARVAILVGGDDRPFSAGLDIKSAMKTFFKDVSSVDKAKVAVSTALGVSTKIRDGGEGMPAMRNQEMHRVIREFQDSISSVARCRVPVIAAINSHCLGGAISLATACDFRFCTSDSKFCVKEVKIGINPDIGTLQRLYPLVGQGRARELTFSARNFSAADAKSYGLVEEVFADKESMLTAARASAVEIASNSPLAVQGAKHVMNVPSERAVQESLDYVRLWNSAFIKSNDLVSFGTAFATKSEPQFTDFVVDSTSPPIAPTKRQV
ncbi:peroxisomal enoyl-coa hydratase, putative [Bodo saltans]|uniref:Peroxisomal enoyl-coa hydratase, putative n=1 Tax=Bodo saltans TaxID=75058 RepID=A0A0S4J4R9_BODSA|nr:peroxisomal enoyl-coa hydratase, putative [Bodo saltans]|eukprot:CUG81535.1 peroxisomal enoyl-coa hydratase, putative [Bodo saltans]